MNREIHLSLDPLEYTDLLNGLIDAGRYYSETNNTPDHSIYRGDQKRLAALREKIDLNIIKHFPEPVGIIGDDGVERLDPYWLETHPTYVETP